MANEILQYNVMVEAALRAVVRQALSDVARVGLPGNHHFYITFRTGYPGAVVPDYLKARYPAEMTIVLQHQFDDLEVDDNAFYVTLTFNHVPERLIVPFSSITVFADPSVNFALPFQAPEMPPEEPVVPPPPEPKETAEKPAEAAEKTGEVVSLDKFRKK
jgi:hypothetical protein